MANKRARPSKRKTASKAAGQASVLPPLKGGEVVLHELGESIAASVACVQDELSRYQSGAGSYVVDEIDLVLPLKVRLDGLGQVLAAIPEDPAAAGATLGQLRLRVKPVLGARQPPVVASGQPLEALKLSRETIDRLRGQRIFSVEDLLRVGRNGAGVAALGKLNRRAGWERIMNKAGVLGSKALPRKVASALLDLGIASPAEFVEAEPSALAQRLSKKTGEAFSEEQIAGWQQQEKAANVKLWKEI